MKCILTRRIFENLLLLLLAGILIYAIKDLVMKIDNKWFLAPLAIVLTCFVADIFNPRK